MKSSKIASIYLTFISFCIGQLPIDLNQNNSFYQTVNLESSVEYLINIDLSSNTSWEEENNESAILTIFVNNVYSQDIVIYNGSDIHTYQQAIGFLESGIYEFEYYFDYEKYSINATNIHIENINLINSTTTNIDQDVFKYSPVLYGRNIFSWNESNHTDIPLMMYYDIYFNI